MAHALVLVNHRGANGNGLLRYFFQYTVAFRSPCHCISTEVHHEHQGKGKQEDRQARISGAGHWQAEFAFAASATIPNHPATIPADR